MWRWLRRLLLPDAPPAPVAPLDAGPLLRDAARRRAAAAELERRAADQARRLEELEARLRLYTRGRGEDE